MSSVSAPNRRLRHLVAQARWTQNELARGVNLVAAESGLTMRLDRRSVTHWLSGRQPRPPLPGLIAEALSRRLGRRVTPGEAGLGFGRQGPCGDWAAGVGPIAAASRETRKREGSPDEWDPPDGRHARNRHDPRAARAPYAALEPAQTGDETAPRDAAGLLRAMAPDTRRRGTAPHGIYTAALLTAPGWGDALRGFRARTRETGTETDADTGYRLEPVQLSAASLMLRVFSDADLTFGGGHSRAALAAYLAGDIAPRLRSRVPPRLRAAMLSTATQLAYICGFMCFDDQDQGRAQRYYRVALELALENNDQDAYAITLRAMSVQATGLGHARHAIQLAEAAAAGRTALSPLRQAFLLGQLAVAAAADGDRATAFGSLSAADRLLQRATSCGPYGADAVVGRYHPAALAFQQAEMQALLGDRKGAIQSLATSLRLRAEAERRGRALTRARLAELHLSEGHLEEAAATWHAFLDDSPYLYSGRVTNALTTMRRRLHPHADHRAARRVLDRAAGLPALRVCGC